MTKLNPKKKAQAMRLARLQIASKLYLRGYSFRAIREEVMRRLDLKTYSLDTVKKDIDILLKEWREERIDDMDASISLELARIDAIIVELWAQWEKSKQDTEKTATKKKGAAKRNDGITGIETQAIEETRASVLGLGNVAYISEIRAQLTERRKLLGLYSPEKRAITEEVTITQKLPCEMSVEEIEAEIKALKITDVTTATE